MKYVSEYRDPALAHRIAEEILRRVTRQRTLMEVCGGQTHAIIRYGLDRMLFEEGRGVELIHGPGCPVCVTPIGLIDRAIAIAKLPGVILTSFGDMLRVPGSESSLLGAKARGGDVRFVSSPLVALDIAKKNPGKEVVFFAVGFETTAPVIALAVHQAHAQEIENFSVLVAHVLVPPAMHAILDAQDNRVQGFLAAGHVCTVMGYIEYIPIAAKYRVPIVVTGFEPIDILQGILMLVTQLEEGRYEVENQYARVVSRQGNVRAQDLVNRIFRVAKRTWRGIGEIPESGLELAPEFSQFDAIKRFPLNIPDGKESGICIAGEVLTGTPPHQCPAFGKECHPENPLGAPMVSSEGACAAHYIRYRRELNK